MKRYLRRNNAWVMLRKAAREGFPAAFGRWRLWRRILETSPVITDHEGPTEVRLMCYFFDYLCAIWALKSFYRASGVRYPLFIHLQGNAPPRIARTLQRHFPNASLVTQSEADSAVNPHLARHGWTRLLAARQANQYLQKLTDTVILSRADSLILLDSDVLFFAKPEELLAFEGELLYQRDAASTYLVDRARGVSVAPRLNAGLMKFRPAGIPLARCNEYLADFPGYQGWLEQTLLALHAGETGQSNVLPATYLISFDATIDPATLIARHYAGPTRPLLTQEGMPWLIRHGFLDR